MHYSPQGWQGLKIYQIFKLVKLPALAELGSAELANNEAGRYRKNFRLQKN